MTTSHYIKAAKVNLRHEYEERGYVKIPSLLDGDEVRRLRKEIDRILNLDIFYEFNWRTVFRRQDGHVIYLERIDPITDIHAHLVCR